MSVNKVNSDGSLSRVAGGTLYADTPIGTISPFGGSTVPSGYLLCNGAEVLKTTYAELYAVIGDAFGTASDNTKFKLPDLREATTKGVGLNGRSAVHYDADGVALGEFIEDRVQEHTHIYTGIHQSSTAYIPISGGSGMDTDDTETGITGKNTGRSGATTEVKAVGVNYIIKAKQVAVPADFKDAIDDALSELTWHYTTVASNGNVVVPSSYSGFYEVNVFDAKKHIFHRGLRLGSDVAIGTVNTNYAVLDNDGILLYEDRIHCMRESVAGDYIVAYRPIQAVAVS